MKFDKIIKEAAIIILSALILGFTVAIPNISAIFSSVIYMLIIMLVNVAAKKITAYYFASTATTNFWSMYQFGFKRNSHFKIPVPLFWVPLLLSFITRGYFLWLAILEFDITPRVERAAKKHGLYRFSEMTDWDVALIASSGVITNLVLAVLAYLAASFAPGLEAFARLSIFYAFWSLIPLSSLDGTKILFGSRKLWFALLVIASIFLTYALIIV